MTVVDILFRVDSICSKYDKYDLDKQRELNAYGDDAFARLYATVDSTIEAALKKSDAALAENNRAAAAAMNAEVRRAKGRLMDEIPKLRKLAKKKVKGLTDEDLAIREDLVLALPERIQAIPDGITTVNQTGGGWTSQPNIKFDSDVHHGTEYFDQTEESSLDFISEGLDTLKNLAHDMSEEMDRQVPLMDEIDTKMITENS
ncbi:Syntaxin [Arachis hypogaea]|nr:Syntaxin [Arachis hypogaea]